MDWLDLSFIVKATALLTAGLFASSLAHRARASVRHAILAAALAALVALPAAAALLPAIAVAVPAAPVSIGLPVAAPDWMPAAEPRAAAPPADSPARGTSARTFDAAAMLQGVWMAGAAWLLIVMSVALWRLQTLRRHALPWLEARPLVEVLSADAGVRRVVDVLLHEEVTAPITCGLLRPAILLPVDARTWDAANLRRALVHELEHVGRHDWSTHLTAQAVCAIYWFHPLVWIAARRLSLEAERACDDAVVAREESTQYAEQLVALARRMRTAAQPALAMASRSDLGARVRAVLDDRLTRGRAGMARAAIVTASAAALVLAIAPMRAAASAPLGPQAASDPGPVVVVEQRRATRVPWMDRALVEAAEEGDVQGVRELLDSGANVNAAVDGDGSPLIAAARDGHIGLVTLLLDRGADPNLGVPGDGNPLIMAAREGHTAAVALLLDRGARIDEVVDGDENALIQAAGEGRLEVVKLLVARGADINARVFVEDGYPRAQSEWRTPLTQAQRGGHRAVVEFLRAAGAVQ